MPRKPTGVKPLKKPREKGSVRKTGRSTDSAKSRPPKGDPAFYALVIGCDCYLDNQLPEGSYPSLRGCVRDATRVEEFLRLRAGLKNANLIRLTSTAGPDGRPVEPAKKRPTYENIVNAFRELTARAKAGDHVYVHYSGHGGQCPTIVPKSKGPGATDEALVPIDIGTKTARYVRDVEVAKLLKEMTAKKLLVTVVLDSCHSGGATRAVRRADDPTGIRGVDFVDRSERPTDSLVGTVEELEAANATAEATRGMGQTRGMTPTDAAANGCVVLTACRPFELAREFMFDGGPSQGALTYWYLKLAGTGTAGLTFRTIFDQVVKRIHDQFPAQTPMLFGDPDRAVLAGTKLPVTPAIPVTAVSGSAVTLGAGEAAQVEVGIEYAIYPPTANVLTAANRSAAVRVTAVGPNEATAELIEKFQARGVQPGDRAVPIGVPLRLVRKVDVLRPDGSPPKSRDVALQNVAAALSGQAWIEPVRKPGDPADFVVTTDETGTTYQICDASDVALAIRPPLSTANPNATRQMAARLVHLARFQAVQTLENPDPTSPLRGQVLVELLGAPPDFKEGGPTHNLKPIPSGVIPRLQPGEWLVLSITNRSSQSVNVSVLDLSSDWSVSVIANDAGQRSFPVPANGGQFRLPLKASLAAGQSKSTDVLKVIATVDPPPAFDLLTLPPLDQPIVRASVTRSAGPLAAILDAAAAERPSTRAMTTGAQPTRGWTVSQVAVEVE
jgi:Caspase domain